jgi:transposase
LAAGKKNAARLGAHLVFADETGFLLIPHVLRTWAPRGQTPVHRHRQRHDRISVISAISVSPRRQRLGLYYQLSFDNIGQAGVAVFLRHLLRHLRGPIIALVDRSQTHQGGPLLELLRRNPRLHIEHFPAYSPELNPDEGVWALMKRRLANSRPDHIDELVLQLLTLLRTLRRDSKTLQGCIRHSGLPPFLR